MRPSQISGIYKITSPTESVYVGQSIDIMERWRSYRKCYENKTQRQLMATFFKHGVDNHKFEVIHLLPNDISQAILDQYEVLYISIYKEAGFKMLNVLDGGRTFRHSVEAKQGMSLYKMGSPNNIVNTKFSGRYEAWVIMYNSGMSINGIARSEMCSQQTVSYALRKMGVKFRPYKRPPEQRFMALVEETDKCWGWKGYVDENGYGVFGIGAKKSMRVIDYSYIVHIGDPKELLVSNICGVKVCSNPAHLILVEKS